MRPLIIDSFAGGGAFEGIGVGADKPAPYTYSTTCSRPSEDMCLQSLSKPRAGELTNNISGISVFSAVSKSSPYLLLTHNKHLLVVTASECVKYASKASVLSFKSLKDPIIFCVQSNDYSCTYHDDCEQKSNQKSCYFIHFNFARDLALSGWRIARIEFEARDLGALFGRRRVFILTSTCLPQLEVAWQAGPSEIERVARAADARGAWDPRVLGALRVDARSAREMKRSESRIRRERIEVLGDSNPPEMMEVVAACIARAAALAPNSTEGRSDCA
ncbi:hypothetical protein CLBKND_04889 [Methylorubrum aminovorans]